MSTRRGERKTGEASGVIPAVKANEQSSRAPASMSVVMP